MQDRAPEPREGTPSRRLSEEQFVARFLSQFADAAFDQLRDELARVAAAAWDAYANQRKSPRTRKAGPEFADPAHDLAEDWIVARAAIQAAQARHDDRAGPLRVLLISCSSRSEHTCPGEMSKSFRLPRSPARFSRARRRCGRSTWSSAAWPRSTDGKLP